MAGRLRGLGVAPGDRVALLATNSPEFLILLFACARIGAMLVPLNWRLAAPEHAYMLEDADADLLVYEAGFAEHVAMLAASRPSCRMLVLAALAGVSEYEAGEPVGGAD